MVIAVEKGLEAVKNYLNERGFHVVDLDSANHFDAAVYESLSFFNIPAPNQPAAKASIGQTGTFLVCARGRTPQEVETMLRQKAYANLF